MHAEPVGLDSRERALLLGLVQSAALHRLVLRGCRSAALMDVWGGGGPLGLEGPGVVLEGIEGGGLSSLLLLLLRCIIKQSLRVELKQPMVGRG